METVHVLGGIDGGDDLLRVDMRGQRKLHQDRMHRRIAVEAADQRQQIALADGLRQAVIERPHAAADGGLGL
jgi:hypothetical protein